jgi:hypothetical protein
MERCLAGEADSVGTVEHRLRAPAERGEGDRPRERGSAPPGADPIARARPGTLAVTFRKCVWPADNNSSLLASSREAVRISQVCQVVPSVTVERT